MELPDGLFHLPSSVLQDQRDTMGAGVIIHAVGCLASQNVRMGKTSHFAENAGVANEGLASFLHRARNPISRELIDRRRV